VVVVVVVVVVVGGTTAAAALLLLLERIRTPNPMTTPAPTSQYNGVLSSL
jgi:NaMN:DMB phosphoribosyltransferase